MTIKIDVIIAEKLWKTNSDISKKVKSLLKEIISKTSVAKATKKIELSVLLTNDAQIQELNKNYRAKNKPTNVLSFPLLDGKKIKNGSFAKTKFVGDELALGDIAIAYQTVLKEAGEQNKTFEDHLTHLLTHSLLHLIGFDHIRKSDAEIMENLEIKILKEMGIGNPY